MLSALTLLHGVCALLYAGLAALVVLRARRSRTGLLLGLACFGTAIWAAAVAGASVALPNASALGVTAASAALDVLRALLWYGFIRHLDRRLRGGAAEAARDRFAGHRLLSRAVAALALVGAVAIALPLLRLWRPEFAAWDPGTGIGGMRLPALMLAVRVGLAVCNLLLLENLYRNTTAEARWHVNLPCIALGGMFAYDILLAADTALLHRVSAPLFEGRALAFAVLAPLLAVAAARNRAWAIDIHVSRTAAFHSATLIAAGGLLMSLAAAGELVRRFGATRLGADGTGADWGGVAEVGLVFAGVVAVAVLVTSGRARSRLRGLVVDHFFSHRYDYRREWSRCIAILSAPVGDGPDAAAAVALHTRVIRAVAEVVDAPGGVLFLRDPGETAFSWAGSWNLPALPAPVMPDHPLVGQFRGGEWIVPLDRFAATGAQDAESGGDAAGEAIGGLQLAVPLASGGCLTGFILAAAPRAAFRLDGEVFDLLRVVAAEVARTIAEQRLTQRLVQTRQLHEYGKRFAFVAHDIKNVSNQLALLLANAEVHLENPAFQRDMLATVGASVQKINTMIKRLQEPEEPRDMARSLVAPADRLPALVAAARPAHGVPLTFEADGRDGRVAMPAAAFDAVVTHLIANAVEASPADAPVRVAIRHEARRLVVDIVDRGCGMTAEFVRDALFRPFRTSKGDGTGIGAYQARELLRDAGGDLLVISQPGQGTTMRVLLPTVGVSAAAAA